MVASNGARAEVERGESERGVQISMKAQQMRWEPGMPRRDGGYNKFNLNKFSEISSETGNLEIR